MKKLSLLIPILAAVALFAQPAFAEDARPNEKIAQAAQGDIAAPNKKITDHESMMQESIKKMQAQMATINQVKDPKKRLKLLQEHSKNMRDSIKMMREMMGGKTMMCAMGSGRMMGGNPASQAGDTATPAPAVQAKPDQKATTDKTSTSQGEKTWVCPMHPEIVRDQPGTCPICGMDLVEVDPSGASQSGHKHMMGGCMMGGMKGGCMKGGCMMGQMMEMTDQHMDMMLMLMEQMIEHNEAAMATRK